MSDLHWKSGITSVQPNRLLVKGYPLDELMGQVSFPQMVYLLLKGELPDANTARLIDAILVSSVDHGTTPPSVLSALTVASTGAPLNAALAAGILSISKYHGGAIEDCMRILKQGMELVRKDSKSLQEATRQIVGEYKAVKKRLSGFGHRIHTNDPRSARLFEIARETGHDGEYLRLAETFVKVLQEETGKHLPLNVDGAIAAVLCELDFDPRLANAFFIMARMPGLVAHIQEENIRQKPMRKIHPTDSEYDGPAERHL